MGKVKTKAAKPKAPDSLELMLFAPGMTPLHRAGLGGLAATLEAMRRRRKLGLIAESNLPGEWNGDQPPWELEADHIKLNFGKPENAGDYLRKLFTFAFGIKDKLIDLPGTYRDELSRAVRAELQLGLTLTFLQFGPHRDLDKPTMQYFDVAGDGKAEIAVDLRACHSYLHQEGLQKLKLIGPKGQLNQKPSELPSAFNPGAVVRHNAFGTETRIDELPPGSIAACFAIVGCLSLAVNRGVGVLLIPEVVDLTQFARARPRMTPTTLRECRIAGASDAALQAQVRLRSKGELNRHGLEGIYALRFRPTQWNEKQKTRVDALHIFGGVDEQLSRFDLALRYLPPRIRSREQRTVLGKGKKKTDLIQPEWFWTESIVRPLAADNIASGRRWYDGFADLMINRDGSRIPNHERISYEREGLFAMVDDNSQGITDADEKALIAAVHRAIYMQRGKIYRDTMGENSSEKPSNACYNRWERLMERLRLGLINAKTKEQTRQLLYHDIFGRAGVTPELKHDHVRESIRRLNFNDEWQRVRDLTMLAVVSYKAPDDDEARSGESEET